MAGTSLVYNVGAYKIATKTVDFTADTIKARLMLTSDAPNMDSASMTGVGITGNDVTLASCTSTNDTTNDRTVFDCANFTFTAQSAGAEVDTMIVFKFVTNDAASIPLFACAVTPTTPDGSDINVTVNADGLAYIQNTAV